MFNAGAIEATLTIDRNPFTEGLKLARAQGKKWASDGFEVKITPVLVQSALIRIKQQLERMAASVKINPKLDQDRMRGVKAQIERQVGNINVRPKLEAGSAAALRERINALSGRINVKTYLDPESFLKLLVRIRETRVSMPVRLTLDSDSLAALRARIRALKFSSDLSLNIDTDRSLAMLARQLSDVRRETASAGREFDKFGESGDRAFSRMHGGMRAIMATLPLLLPVAGSAITGVLGLVGALTAAFVGAGAGVGAFALVAVPLFKQVRDAVAAGQEEINKLPGSLKNAGNALKRLNDQVKILSDAARQGVGFAFTAAFNAATAAIRPLLPLINSVSAAIVLIGKSAQEYFKTSHYTDFIGMLSKNMVPLLTTMFEIIAYGTRAVMNLTTAFMPMAQWLLRAMADGMKDFATWTGTLASDPRFHQWVETAKEALRRMWEFLVSATKFLFEFAYAMAPLGSAIFKVLAIIFNGLSKLPPEWLNGIALGLAAIFTAMMLGASGPIGLAIGAIVGIAAALTTLYNSNENVRKSVDDFMGSLKRDFLPIWEMIRDNFENKIVPAWNTMADAYNKNLKPVLEDLGKKFREDILPVLSQVADTLTGKLIPSFLNFMEAIAPFVAFLTSTLGSTLIGELKGALLVVDGILLTLTGIFQTATGLITGDWDLMLQGLRNTGEGVLNTIVGMFGLKMDEIVHYFQNDFGPQFQSDWEGFWNRLHTWWTDYFATPTKTLWEGYLTTLETTLGIHEGTINSAWFKFWDDLRIKAIEIWDDLKLKWSEFWTGEGSIGGVLEGEKPGIQTEWESFWSFLGIKFDEFTTSFNEGWNTFWGDIGTKFTEFTTSFNEGWNAFWDGFLTGLGLNSAEVKAGWDQWWVDMQTSVQLKWDEILTGWNSFLVGIGEWFAQESAKFNESWNVFWDGVSLKAQEIWADLTAKWNEFWATGFGATLTAEIEKFNTTWNEFWDGVRLKAEEIFLDLSTKWNDFWEKNINSKLQEEIAKFNESWTTFWDGVKLKIDEILPGIQTAWNDFWAQFGGSQETGEATSTQSWAEFWGSLGLNIGNFIRDTINAWVGFWGGIRTEQDGKQSEVEGSWNTFWGGLVGGADRWWQDLLRGWTGMLADFVTEARRIWAEIERAFNDGVNAAKGILNGFINTANGALGALGAPRIPNLAVGGILSTSVIHKFASGGQLFNPIGSGFKTKGPRAIVGEGSSKYPEYVIPTDPKYRARAMRLYEGLSADLQLMQAGGTFERSAPLNGASGSGSTLTSQRASNTSSPGMTDEAILRKLDELIDTIRATAGPPVINVNTDSGKANNRNDPLALRLGRR